MLELPTQVMTEKINEIEDAYSSLTTAMSTNILATSAGQRKYDQLNQSMNNLTKMMEKRNGRILTSKTPPTSIAGVNYQNNGITNTIDTSKLGINANNINISANSANLDASRIMSLSNYSKPSFIGQNQAYMTNLDMVRQETMLKNQNYIGAWDVYNSLKKNANATDEQIKIAKEHLVDVRKEAEEANANLAKLESEAVATMVSNIETYFSRVNGFIDSVNNSLKSTRDYVTNIFGYANNISKINYSIKSSVNNTLLGFRAIQAELQTVQGQLDEAVTTNIISNSDDEYVDILTKVNNLQGDLVSKAQQYFDLLEESYNLPLNVAEEKVQKLTDKYALLNAVVSNNNLATKANQQSLIKLINSTEDATGASERHIVSEQRYVMQNAALRVSLNKTKQEYDIMSSALKEAKDNLVNLETQTNVTAEELKAAENAVNTATKNFVNKQAEYAAAMVNMARQSVQNISDYYDTLISHTESMISRIKSNIDLVIKMGKDVDRSTGILITDVHKMGKYYTNQISTLHREQAIIATDIVKQEAEIQKYKEIIGEDTDDYRAMEQKLNDLKNSYDQITISIEDLYDTIRKELYIQPIDDAIERLQNLQDTLGGINSLIDEEMKLTKEGDYTDMGKLSLVIDFASYDLSLKEVEKAKARFDEINERWQNDASYSDEEYMVDRQETIQKYQSALNSVLSNRNSILDTIKNRYRTEIDYIKELINAQSEELQKRKSLNDYDKSLKDKTKATRQIEA